MDFMFFPVIFLFASLKKHRFVYQHKRKSNYYTNIFNTMYLLPFFYLPSTSATLIKL